MVVPSLKRIFWSNGNKLSIIRSIQVNTKYFFRNSKDQYTKYRQERIKAKESDPGYTKLVQDSEAFFVKIEEAFNSLGAHEQIAVSSLTKFTWNNRWNLNDISTQPSLSSSINPPLIPRQIRRPMDQVPLNTSTAPAVPIFPTGTIKINAPAPAPPTPETLHKSNPFISPVPFPEEITTMLTYNASTGLLQYHSLQSNVDKVYYCL